MRDALGDDVFDAVFFAKIFLRGRVSVGIDEEDVGLEFEYVFLEVHDAASAIDPRILDAFECLDHVEAFGVGIDGFPGFESENRGVAADADVEIAELGGFFKKRYVPAVEHVVATGDENFFVGHKEKIGVRRRV